MSLSAMIAGMSTGMVCGMAFWRAIASTVRERLGEGPRRKLADSFHYKSPQLLEELVEPGGIEPPTSSMPLKRSPN
jgi:hypothetical protein